MNSTTIPIDNIESLDNKFQVLDKRNVDILKCNGLPHPLWNTKCITLYNNKGIIVGEGSCYYFNSKLVFGANDTLNDTHVVIHIS